MSTPDPAGAERFYTAVFGWEYVHAGAAYDHYTYAAADRQMVAGIAPARDGGTGWVVAFATDSAEAVAERVRQAGGDIAEGPEDFGVQGRSVLAVDPAGAHVAFWQPRAHLGAGRVGEPSSLCWAELAVRDVAGADRFYAAVLGLRAAEHAAAGSADYAAYRLDGEPVAGRTVLRAGQQDVEPFWMPYFGATDAGAAVRTAEREGGSVLFSGATGEGAGLAVLADPWGATFAVLELAAREPDGSAGVG
nr:VOC family protein [Streptomyces boncukensis]